MLSGRRAPATSLVLFGAVVLVVTAVCPRGMLRALAASEAAIPRRSVPGVVERPDDGLRLPGVRAAVGREEDEPHDLRSSDGASHAVPVVTPGGAGAPSLVAAALDAAATASAVPGRPGRGRAPPAAT